MKNKTNNVWLNILTLIVFAWILYTCTANINILKSMKETNGKLKEIASNTDAEKEEVLAKFNIIEEDINNNNIEIKNIKKDIDSLIINDTSLEPEDSENECVEAMSIQNSNNYSNYNTYYTTDGLTASGGVNYYGDQKETYYNLNMNNIINNAHSAGIEGEYWVREDGVKMFGDKVIVSANQEVYPYGSTVETSLGTGIVLDTGEFAHSNPTQVDIATDW